MEREGQYVEALEFYLKLGVPLVFCENTNTHSERIKALMVSRKDVEYFIFPTKLSYLGKSHGEQEIIEYALEHSGLLREAEWVVKISGRYIIENIRQFLNDLEGVKAEVLANFSHHLTWADTKLMCFTKDFYSRYFKPCLEQYLNDSKKMCFEKVFARSVHLCLAAGGTYREWRHYPYYKGICGGSGKTYIFGPVRRIKFNIYFGIKNWVYRQHV